VDFSVRPAHGRARQKEEQMTTTGTIRAGIGGWNFEPWEGTFYPADLPKKRQLEFASRAASTIEINATYYRGQTPATFAKWAAEVPEGFVFALKGNRFVTNRKVLAEAGPSLEKFFAQGLEELGPALGPLVWQFAPTKKFEPDDFEAFVKLLPREHAGLAAPRAGGAPRLLRRAGIRRHRPAPRRGDLLRPPPRLSRDRRRDGRFRLCPPAEGRGRHPHRL
jgi:uncharacterized protein YecE (DUF72 family)